MAKRSRQRRREAPGGGRSAAHDVRELLFAATAALCGHDQRSFPKAMALLEHVAAVPEGRVTVEQEVGACLAEAVRGAWARGWQPADLSGVAGRKLTAAHRRYIADVIVADAAAHGHEAVHPRWAAQLDSLGTGVWWAPDDPHLSQWAHREGLDWAGVLTLGIELLALLFRLPPLPLLVDPPGGAGGRRVRPTRRHPGEGHDSRILVRVRALLAKAESTTFPEEAEALTAKAQELMARHAIDDAMVDAQTGGSGDEPVGVRVQVDAPYASPKSLLLTEVASANRCRAVWSNDLGFSTIFGFESDTDFVDMLYTSLLVQATRAMVAAGSQADRYGRSRTRSFRTSFLVSYATRIGQRLRAAEAASRAAAAEDYGVALVPVLADRSSAVDDACHTAFPHIVSRSVSTTNLAGWRAGAAAADLATLSSRPEVRSRPAP